MPRQWFYAKGETRHGPAEENDLAGMIRAGRLRNADLLWTDGMPSWRPVGEIGLFWPQHAGNGGSPPLPPHPPASAATPAREHPQATSALVLAILSWVILGPILSVPAWIKARSALRDMEHAPERFTNERTAEVAHTVARINAVLYGFGALVYVVAVLVNS